MNELPTEARQRLERWQRGSLIVGLAACVACTAGAFFHTVPFFRAYLVAYLFFLGLAHGCLIALMIYHLTGGAWGFLIRRILEAGMGTLPLFAVLFIPIGLGVGELYPWAQPETAVSHSVEHKQIYLNVPFFWLRAVVYFASWLIIAHFLKSWSRQQDLVPSPEAALRLGGRMGRLSGPGLVVFGITITFASVDWLMSLQPDFRSTIFGPLFASGELLTGFSCTLIILAVLVLRSPLDDLISRDALNDLGSLLFTFLNIWAYMTFFQFMLIWMANLPYDVLWYVPRSHGGWEWLALVLVFCHFVIPFFLLLSRDVKRAPGALAILAGMILLSHLAYMYYQVLPAFAPGDWTEHWLDVGAPVALGGLWLSFFLWNVQRAPLLPVHDANREAALHYRELDRAFPEAHHA